MKKIFTIFMAMIMTILAFAQENPNRMLVVRPNGSYGAYNLDNVQELQFATIDGPVACYINYDSCTETSVSFSLELSLECDKYLINVYPAVIARQLVKNPSGAAEYMKMTGSPEDSRDGDGITLSGLELTPGGEYAIVTLGFDQLGCEGDVTMAEFYVPTQPLVGNPQVTTTVTGTTLNSITAKFVANSDVKGFAAVMSEKGVLEDQYDMFAGMMGFSCMGDMIKSWGVNYPGNSTQSYTWSDLTPNTEFEIYVQAWDVNGTYLPVQKVLVSTDSQGGDGASVITIKPGDYVMADWYGEQLPSQFFSFTPNDQTWCYRIGVYLESNYVGNEEAIKKELCSDPEMPMAYWFLYEPITTDYQINPDTSVVVIAAGKNAKGEWGEMSELRYTTPATVGGAKAPAVSNGVVSKRFVEKQVRAEQGKVRTNRVVLSR